MSIRGWKAIDPPDGTCSALRATHLVGHASTELEQQPGLADPGLAGDEDHLSLAAPRSLEALGEHVQLALASDERRQSSFPLYVESRAARHAPL